MGMYFDVHGHKIPGLYTLLKAPELCLNLSQTATDDAAVQIVNWLEKGTKNNQQVIKEVEGLRKKRMFGCKIILPVWPHRRY